MYKQNAKYKILTKNGFEDFLGIQEVNRPKKLKITLENNEFIECSETHYFIVNNKDVCALKINTGDFLEYKDDFKKVISIEYIDGNVELYDVVGVESKRYYTNNILSHNCDFAKSGNTVIEWEVYNYYEQFKIVCEPKDRIGFDRNLWVWKNPDSARSYLLCADVARGDGADYSAFHVISLEDLEQVAEYKGKITPDIFGHLMAEMGKKYNNALIVCENNSIGYAAVQKLLDVQYPKVFWSSKVGGMAFVDPLNWNHPGENKIPGFQTTMRTRPLLISAFEEALRTKSFTFHSVRLLEEIKVFIYDEHGKAQASEGYNDDLIMSVAIGLYIRNTALRMSNSTALGIKNIVDGIATDKTASAMIAAIVSPNKIQFNPYLIGGEDFRWLLKD